MNKTGINFLAAAAMAFTMSGCAYTEKTIREPNSRVDFTKNDFTFSEQVSGEGKTVKILGFDLYRRNHSIDMGTISQQTSNKFTLAVLPVIGTYLSDESSSYALYDLMSKNPGYDVVFYPQFEKHEYKPFLGIGIIYKKTTVKATARLGKLKA
jgi:hypothetical protein